MSTRNSIRVGVIGTGFGGVVQLPGFRRSPGVELVAVASGRQERARELGERYGIAGYADYRRMLDEQELDLVSVTTPPYLHHEMVMAALERGRNVLCEKPLAANLGQAREMLATAETAGVVHAVDHEFRYLPARLKMKQLVDEGYLGELKMVRVTGLNDTWHNRPWGWIMEKEKCGGILQAQGSHLIDSLHWWFGPIVEVGAQLDTLLTSRPTEGGEWRRCDAEDQVAALLRMANGAHVNYLISGSIRPGQNRVEAYGSEGTLIIDESRLLGARGTDEPRPIDPGTSLPKLEQGDDFRLAPFLAFLERFLPRLRGEPAPETVAGFQEGVAVQAVMDAMRQSDAEKRFVQVEPV